MNINATYNVTYKITDRDLFDRMSDEDDNTEWVKFLTAVMDSVRYSEDWTKRCVQTYGDELWWDDDAGYGILQLEIEIGNNFGDDIEHFESWVEDLKMNWETNVPDKATEFKPEDIITLVTPKYTESGWGPLFAIVRFGSTVYDEENMDGDGCFLEYDNEDYAGNIHNMDPIKIDFVTAQFTNHEGIEYAFYDDEGDGEDIYFETV